MTDLLSNGGNTPIFRAAFGAGSWNFGLRRELPFTLDADEYVMLLQKGLETVSSLNNLVVSPRSDRQLKIRSDWLTPTSSGPAIFPDGVVRHMKFDLYIPFRIQNELVGPDAQSNTLTETFRVYVRYPYHGAVSYVQLVGDRISPRPASAMQIVREYMKAQFRHSSTDVVFESVGPTPFHADFWVAGYPTPNENERELDFRQRDTPGYAKIVFRCYTERTRTVEDAFDTLFRALDDELGFFYSMHRRDLDSYDRWEDIENMTANLVGDLEQKAWYHGIRKALARSRELTKLHVALTQFEKNHIVDEQSLLSHKNTNEGGPEELACVMME